MPVRRRPRIYQVASILLVCLYGVATAPMTGATRSAGQPFDAPAAVAATYVVNSASDPGEGVCNPANCTLREALNAANNNPGTDSVTFNIPGTGPHTISPTEALPTIIGPVIIDGYKQPGASPNTLAQGNNAVLKIEVGGATHAWDCLRISAGSTTVRGLVINLCGGAGIYLEGSGNNIIEGNFIGTDVSGTTGLDGLARARIYIDNVPNNRIGGTTPAARNVLSGGATQGIAILGGNASGNLVQGNYIGTDKSGTLDADRWNTPGIYIGYAPNNTIGGTAPGARNLISSNGSLQASVASPGIVIAGAPATGNVVQGNYIGTDVTGSLSLGNGGEGVLIENAANNVIGGTAPGEGNLISGNGYYGVSLLNDNVREGEASNNRVQGNLIGADKTGTVALANGGGVRIDSADNIVGGVESGAGNLISGNATIGVLLLGPRALVQGNLIGTDKAGEAAIGNGHHGIVVSGRNATIGGTQPGMGNVISGNDQYGILIWIDSQVTVADTVVQGNYIGTNKEGTAPIGNQEGGIRIEPNYHALIPTNTIGGTAEGAANVISGNYGNGVFLPGGSALLQGNYIGTNAQGATNLGNEGHGVLFSDGSGNTIGGMGAGEGNVIAYNGKAGIASDIHPQGTGNVILRNSIFANGGLGIDLYANGVTVNDPGDTDTGSNKRQNFPVLTSASSMAGSTTITGTLNSISNTTFTLLFFANITCDPSGYGEGQRFLGQTSVTTNSSSNASFATTLPGTVSGGESVAAIAIDPQGNTSEFSHCVAASGPTATPTPTSTPQAPTATPQIPTVTVTSTSMPQMTSATPTLTSTPQTPTATPPPTVCTSAFTDVPTGSAFHAYVRCLACRNIVSGYEDGTFRPADAVTRGQLAKIVANAADFNEVVSGQTFSDVAPGSPFYLFIERVAGRGVVSGYEDGTFRPGDQASRGQVSKIVANAAGFSEPVSGQTFSDVPPAHTFYAYIERLARRGVLGGYEDGTFRPGNNTSRGQVAKIVSNTFYPECNP